MICGGSQQRLLALDYFGMVYRSAAGSAGRWDCIRRNLGSTFGRPLGTQAEACFCCLESGLAFERWLMRPPKRSTSQLRSAASCKGGPSTKTVHALNLPRDYSWCCCSLTYLTLRHKVALIGSVRLSLVTPTISLIQPQQSPDRTSNFWDDGRLFSICCSRLCCARGCQQANI